jgi:hypothetical protein
MAPTLLNVAVGVLLAVALLGAAFDRRSVAIVAGAAALPDLDTVFAVVGPAGPNAVLHTLVVVVGAAALLYDDTERGDRSRIAGRYGWRGVRIAWVALAAYAVAGVGLDAFSAEGVALLYPLSDRYYTIAGRLLLSTQEGLVQTYVTWGDGWFQIASPGTVRSHTVESPLVATGGDRRVRLVESGWQVVVVLTAAASIPAKYLIERHDRSRGGGS